MQVKINIRRRHEIFSHIFFSKRFSTAGFYYSILYMCLTSPSGELLPPSNELFPPCNELFSPSNELFLPSNELFPPCNELFPK
jgi:hypothetical protein